MQNVTYFYLGEKSVGGNFPHNKIKNTYTYVKHPRVLTYLLICLEFADFSSKWKGRTVFYRITILSEFVFEKVLFKGFL